MPNIPESILKMIVLLDIVLRRAADDGTAALVGIAEVLSVRCVDSHCVTPRCMAPCTGVFCWRLPASRKSFRHAASTRTASRCRGSNNLRRVAFHYVAACRTMFGLRVPFVGEPPAMGLSYQLSHPSSISLSLSHTSCHIRVVSSHVSRLMAHGSRLTSHVSRLTSHVSRLTSHVSRLTSHVSRLTSRRVACRVVTYPYLM